MKKVAVVAHVEFSCFVALLNMADDCGASTTLGLSGPTSQSREKRREDLSDDGVTSKNVISDKEERVEAMIHLPLPNAFKSKSDVFRAKQRFTPLQVENLRVAIQYIRLHSFRATFFGS